jgi:hypothetical protein
MKINYKIAIVLILMMGVYKSNAQVGIGVTTVPANAIMVFDNTLLGGITLPVLSANPATVVNGAIFANEADDKVYWGSNGAWVALTDAGSIPAYTNTASDLGDGVIIGANANTTGVSAILELVANSTAKAMVLPILSNPHLNIKSPAAGTICYDDVYGGVAIFNGTKWDYWK